MNDLKGYECIKILIAIRLSMLKGLKMYKEGVALKRKIVFPLFRTINVCGEKETEKKITRQLEHFQSKLHGTYYSVHGLQTQNPSCSKNTITTSQLLLPSRHGCSSRPSHHSICSEAFEGM